MAKIGVLGPHGRLGKNVERLGADPIEADITDYKSLQDALYQKNFDVIINCAAYTHVDDAEKKENQEKVINVNYKSLTLILAAIPPKTHLVHISTDYVFGGTRGPYTERMKFTKHDKPVNFYGLTKQAAELALSEYPRTSIVRTTGLFGSGSPDFVTLVKDHLVSGKELCVADDLCGNQTYVPFLSEQLIQLCEMENRPPLIHLASTDVQSRLNFVFHIMKKLNVASLLSSCIVSKHSSEIWDVPRPLRSGLDVSLSKKLGFKQYSIADGLGAYIGSFK